MGKYVLRVLVFFLGIASLPLSAADLTLRDIRRTMDQMFVYHVENRSLSPLVIKRSVKLYLEQFDRNKIYFKTDDISDFLDLSSRDIAKIRSAFRKDQYPHYKKINDLIGSVITRQRKARDQIIAELIEQDEMGPGKIKSYPLYASSENELKTRTRLRLQGMLRYTLNKRKIKEVTKELRAKILHFWNEKLNQSESDYLQQTRSKHFLATHILKAMARSLDAHSYYFTPEEAFEIRMSLQKQLVGIGVGIHLDFDGIYIEQLLDGGPAKKSGKLKKGDKILEINGTNISNMTSDEIDKLLSGKAGSNVRLKIERDGWASRVMLKRAKVILDTERVSVKYEPVAGGVIGKITIPSFYDNFEGVSTERDVREAIKWLKSEGDLLGLVLDLRRNAGGFLHQAVKLSGVFIDHGVIVISKYAEGEVRYSRDLDGRQFYNGPLAMLTSKASASSSEVVAQALQDYGAGLVVGDDRTYGKGSMQFQTMTSDKADLFFSVTVGRYYTASGRSPQIRGVEADIIVPTVFAPYNIGEKFLQYPLPADQMNRLKMEVSAASVVPYLKPLDSKWRKMLSKLKINSARRLEKSKDFQYFLKVLGGYTPTERDKKQGLDNFGKQDLHMQEAVAIVKDMIALN